MPKKTLYVATDATGQQHTRTSARVYTHAVVYLPSFEDRMASANDKCWQSTDAKNYQYYASCIEHGFHKNLMHFEHYRNDAMSQANDVREAREKIAGQTKAEYVEALRVERVNRVHALKEDGYFTKWQLEGFCGRYDLAQKLAQKMHDQAAVEILPAVTK